MANMQISSIVARRRQHHSNNGSVHLRGDIGSPEVKQTDLIGKSVAASTAFVAYVAIAMFGLNFSLALGLTTSGLAAVVLIPVWWKQSTGPAFGRRWLLLTTAVAFSGFALFLTRPYGLAVSYMSAVTITIYVVSASLAGLMTVWALKSVGLKKVVAAYSTGLILATVTRASAVIDNPWKFGFALPLTLLALIILVRLFGPLAGAIVALLLSGALSAIFDSRSLIGFSLGTILIVLYSQLVRPSRLTAVLFLRHALVLAGAGIILYLTTAHLLISGFFGEQIARRTVAQMYRSSNLLDSGRPEWRISTQLLGDYPLGLGPGATPGFAQRLAGAAGLDPLGLSVRSDYFSDYVFGGVLKLHSVTFDLWSNFGLIGLMTGVLIGSILLAALISQILSANTSALRCYVYLTSMWACFFSPILTSLPIVIFGLSVATHQFVYQSEALPRKRKQDAPKSD